MGLANAPRKDSRLPNPPHDGAGIGWPDWSDYPVAIIASGPSAKRIDLAPLRGRAKVIAIKENVELCPWADLVYGCDKAWWQYRQGLPTFAGLKVCWGGNGLDGYPDIRRIALVPNKAKTFSTTLHLDEVGTIGAGGNSGFQALNLALQLGRARHPIILIGFDMSESGGKHWYGRNRWTGAHNPDGSAFERWCKAFDAALPVLASIGARVFNASPQSALKAFPFRTIEQALDEAGTIDMDRL